MFEPIEFESYRELRQEVLWILGLGELRTEPIKNPVTGERHRAGIVLPGGLLISITSGPTSSGEAQ